jgi:hypothetical protein
MPTIRRFLVVIVTTGIVAVPAGASASVTLDGSFSIAVQKPNFAGICPSGVADECGTMQLIGLGAADWAYVFGPTFEPNGRCFTVDGTLTIMLQSDGSTISGPADRRLLSSPVSNWSPASLAKVVRQPLCGGRQRRVRRRDRPVCRALWRRELPHVQRRRPLQGDADRHPQRLMAAGRAASTAADTASPEALHIPRPAGNLGPQPTELDRSRPAAVAACANTTPSGQISVPLRTRAQQPGPDIRWLPGSLAKPNGDPSFPLVSRNGLVIDVDETLARGGRAEAPGASRIYCAQDDQHEQTAHRRALPRSAIAGVARRPKSRALAAVVAP